MRNAATYTPDASATPATPINVSAEPEQLPGGYRCERCKATGPYPVDSTTPKHAFRLLFESCPDCDPNGEDAFHYIDLKGNRLSIIPS